MVTTKTASALVNALAVLTRDPRLCGWLATSDPKALEQIEDALAAAAAEGVHPTARTLAEVILAPAAPPKPPARWGKIAELSSEDFAGDILSAVGDAPTIDAREVLLRIKQRRRCHKLNVNGRPAGLAEVRQMAARLAREGKLALNGDSLGAA
jgi:hypothetical protein